MGDLGEDTAVEQVDDGQFRATLSADWEIWGPMGGYVASTALRAVGATTPFARPASFFCHYLGVAAFDTVDITVTQLRSARTAAAHRAEVTQDGKPILQASVWSIGDVDGLEHDLAVPPGVPSPDDLKTIPELLADAGVEGGGPPFAFWNNLDTKPLDFYPEWPPPEPLPPVWQQWCRFTPTATIPDPWLDACRSLVLVDVQSWPAASRPHVHGVQQFYAPSLDLYVAFQDPQPDSEWLLCDGYAPVARHGLMGWTGRLWSPDGHLAASGGGQLLCRRMPSAAG
jgi:acyl-CoA thioesterase II